MAVGLLCRLPRRSSATKKTDADMKADVTHLLYDAVEMFAVVALVVTLAQLHHFLEQLCPAQRVHIVGLAEGAREGL